MNTTKTDRQYVERAAQMMGVNLMPPTKKAPGILGMHWVKGFGYCVVDAETWADARKQIDTYAHQRANA